MITQSSKFVNDIVTLFDDSNGPHGGPLDAVWGPYVDNRPRRLSFPWGRSGAVWANVGRVTTG